MSLSLVAALVIVLTAVALFFSFVAVVGFYRLPDVYARTHAASKSETVGAVAALAAAAVAFGTTSEAIKLVLLAMFVFITSPTAAHVVVRSAADAGLEPWTDADADEDYTGRNGLR